VTALLKLGDEALTLAAVGVFLSAVLRDRNTHERAVAHPFWGYSVAGFLFSVAVIWAVAEGGEPWWWPGVPFAGSAASIIVARVNQQCNEATRGWTG
jgi:hypothetical protein